MIILFITEIEERVAAIRNFRMPLPSFVRHYDDVSSLHFSSDGTPVLVLDIVFVMKGCCFKVIFIFSFVSLKNTVV